MMMYVQDHLQVLECLRCFGGKHPCYSLLNISHGLPSFSFFRVWVDTLILLKEVHVGREIYAVRDKSRGTYYNCSQRCIRRLRWLRCCQHCTKVLFGRYCREQPEQLLQLLQPVQPLWPLKPVEFSRGRAAFYAQLSAILVHIDNSIN